MAVWKRSGGPVQPRTGGALIVDDGRKPRHCQTAGWRSVVGSARFMGAKIGCGVFGLVRVVNRQPLRAVWRWRVCQKYLSESSLSTFRV